MQIKAQIHLKLTKDELGPNFRPFPHCAMKVMSASGTKQTCLVTPPTSGSDPKQTFHPLSLYLMQINVIARAIPHDSPLRGLRFRSHGAVVRLDRGR